MKPYIFFINAEKDKVVLTKEEVEFLIEKAYEAGYSDGKGEQNDKG